MPTETSCFNTPLQIYSEMRIVFNPLRAGFLDSLQAC